MGYLGPERRRQDDDDPSPSRADPPDGRARARSSASTARASSSMLTASWLTWPARRACGPLSPGPRRSTARSACRAGRDDAYRDELIARFDLDPSKKVRAYSKGNRQKLILIAALMTRPALLVLDEPTSGLDPLMEQAFRLCVHEARERGQTVFLSSHILSEVEALCDRVGILRQGLLVEMGTLAEMRHLSALSVEATFEGEVPDLSGVPGVSAVEVVGQVVRCQVRGTIEPLLKVLA